MFVNFFVKQFAIYLGVFVILLLNVMELLSVVGGALLDRPCMVFRKMCVLEGDIPLYILISYVSLFEPYSIGIIEEIQNDLE